jgi:hypothetical protein
MCAGTPPWLRRGEGVVSVKNQSGRYTVRFLSENIDIALQGEYKSTPKEAV